MALTVKDFWKLVVQSQLHSVDACRQLAAEFSQMKGAAKASAETLAAWLVDRKALTRYQSKILLSGKPGPFVYGDYQVVDRIKSGRLNGLFHAVHVPSGHPVLLRFLSSTASDPNRFAAIREAASQASTVSSPYTTRCYEVVDVAPYRFIVLERLEGMSLKERLAQGAIPVKEACRIARDVALGLDALYEAGRGHNEIRPENIWLDAAGHARVLQFPLDRDPASASATMPLSAGEKLAELAPYFSPEVAANALGDERSDIYSLGCVLFEMLCGEPAFHGPDSLQVLRRHASDPVPPLDLVAPQKVPEPVAQVVGYMMAKDPGSRYQRTDNVAQALTPYLDPAAAQFVPPAASATESAFHRQRIAAALTHAHAVADAPCYQQSPSPMTAHPPMGAQPQGMGHLQTPAVAPGVAHPQAPVAGGTVPAAAVVPVVPVVQPYSQQYAAGGPMVAPIAAETAAPVGFPASPMVAPAGRQGASSVLADRGRNKNRNSMMIVGIVAVAGLMLLWIFTRGGGIAPTPTNTAENTGETGTSQTTPVTNPNPTVTPQSTSQPGSTTSPGQPSPPVPTAVKTAAIQPLEGAAWATPAVGEPIDLRFLPRGAQLFVWLRPADLLAHPQGKMLVGAPSEPTMYDLLGGLGPMFRDDLKRLTGVPAENLESVVLGFMPGDSGKPPRVSFVARMRNAQSPDQLRAAWGNAEKARLGEHELYANETMGYYLPPGDPNLVVGAPMNPVAKQGETQPPIAEAIANGTTPPPLRRELEALLDHTNRDWMFSLLFAPNFLFTEGDAIWSGPATILKEPVERFLGDNAQAALVHLHLEDATCFIELRVYGDSGVLPNQVAGNLRNQVQQAPSQIKDFILSFNSSPYSRKILYEYPNMLTAVADRVHVGTADGHAVLQFFLPDVAAPNIAYGSYLTLLERPGGGSVASAGGQPGTTSGGATDPPQPKTVADILAQKKITLTFNRDTLEKTMEYIAAEIQVPITILGSDLQLEGITKNQSFGLDEKDKPAGEVLRTVMKLANPGGQLIYVIKQEGGQEVIHITTRASAEKRGDKIPTELQ